MVLAFLIFYNSFRVINVKDDYFSILKPNSQFIPVFVQFKFSATCQI